MILKEISPGSLIGFKGHIMLYLGEDEEEFYVINALWSFCLPDGKFKNPLCVVINPLSLRRKNGKVWFDEIDTIIDIKNFK